MKWSNFIKITVENILIQSLIEFRDDRMTSSHCYIFTFNFLLED